MNLLCLTKAILVMSVALPLTAQWSAATRVNNRAGIAYSEITGKVYVVDQEHDAVSVIDTSGVQRSINVGGSPEALAVNQATGTLYVINAAGRSVSVVDGVSDEVQKTISLNAHPYAVALDQFTGKVYVPESAVIDERMKTVQAMRMGAPDAMVVDGQRERLYMIGYEGNAVMVLDLKTRRSYRVPVGEAHLWGLALAGRTLYVTHIQGSSLAAVDVETKKVRFIEVGKMPCALALDSTSPDLLVANYGDGSVSVIDTKTQRVRYTVDIGGKPQAVAVDGDNRMAYVADAQNRTVSVISLKTHKLIDAIKLIEAPYGLAINKKNHGVIASTMGTKGFIKIASASRTR